MTTWFVRFHGRLNNAARSGIVAAGGRLSGSRSGGFGAPGAQLPELDHHTVRISADDEASAIKAVQDALEPHGSFGDFTAATAE